MAWKPAAFPSRSIRPEANSAPITRLVGKWFTSQQRTPADRASLAGYLRERPQNLSAAMASLIDQVDRQDG